MEVGQGHAEDAVATGDRAPVADPLSRASQEGQNRLVTG